MISSDILGVTSVALYLVSSILLLRPIMRGTSITRKSLLLLPATLGLLTHGLLLLRSIIIQDGLDLNFINALSLTAWLMVTMLILLSARQPIESLGVAVLPIAALTVLSTTVYEPGEHSIDLNIQSHVFFSVTAYGLLGLAALQAILVWVQSRHLHNHKPGGFIRALPPLNLMENILFAMLTMGFMLLSLSLLTGFIFLDDMFAQHLVHKTVLSIGAWVLFGVLLFGRWRYGWRGKRAVHWTLWAFALLILAYFGSKFVLEIVIGVKTGG
ncbi:MAG: cytochrome c biogenesis protein CcsA [Gammaproteobacteria bacterium]|nr:cytochrome c biogenesis protein CcsA [Gammaproteobacteria bacterium]